MPWAAPRAGILGYMRLPASRATTLPHSRALGEAYQMKVFVCHKNHI